MMKPREEEGWKKHLSIEGNETTGEQWQEIRHCNCSREAFWEWTYWKPTGGMSASPYVLNMWWGFWSRDEEWWSDNVQPLRYALSKRNVFLKMQRYSSRPKRVRRYVHADNGRTLIMFEGLAMSVCVSMMRPICSIESVKTDTPVQWHPLYSWSFNSKHHCSVPCHQCKNRYGTMAEKWTGWPVQVDLSAKANTLVYSCDT